MTAESYSLTEVAERLGLSRRTLQRRIQEGAFPGRYLAPGISGLEMRIPAADVHRLQEASSSGVDASDLPESALTEIEVREEVVDASDAAMTMTPALAPLAFSPDRRFESAGTLVPRPVEEKQDSLLPMPEGDIAISSAPLILNEGVEAEPVDLRNAVMGLLREERATFLDAVREAVGARDAEISDLKAEITALRESLAATKTMVEEFGGLMQRRIGEQVERPSAWSEVLGGPSGASGLDVDHLLRELGELEALVDSLPDS